MSDTPAPTLLRRAWDYIIVGGGSAGCVLARRLSEDPAAQVLLIEAGEEARDPAIFAPPAWPMLAGGAHDWAYASTPQAGLLGRTLGQPRGKGLGGSSLINALGYQRGPQAVYDRWARATGDAGWGFAGLLPYFRRLETASAGANAWRGGDGPLQVLHVGHAGDTIALAHAYAQAGVAAGHALNPDWNGAWADGTIWTQLTIRDGLTHNGLTHSGQRDTAASAFVDPVRGRANLGVLTGVRARRLLVAGGHCTGVEVLVDGALHRLTAGREVILSAGAIDSPRLLMLSGVGPAAALRAIGIAPVHDLPGVGQNLHDHPLVAGLLYQARRPVPASRYNHCETMVIASSRQRPGAGDLQLMGLAVPFTLPEQGPPPADAFSIVPALMQPLSRGSLTLTSADPDASPRIDPAYLSDPRDVAALVDGFELARDIAVQPAMQDWIAAEIRPGPAVTDRAALAEHIRRTVSPFFHPVSTCRMGIADDAMAVVDPACRLRGIAGLRVVDASVFPEIPQAMTQAAVLAVAERASDLIRGME